MPVVIFPGLSAAPLEARLKTKVRTLLLQSLEETLFLINFVSTVFLSKGAPHIYCTRNTGSRWVLLWMSSSVVLPGLRDCFEFDMAMHFDETTNAFVNREGVVMVGPPLLLFSFPCLAFGSEKICHAQDCPLPLLRSKHFHLSDRALSAGQRLWQHRVHRLRKSSFQDGPNLRAISQQSGSSPLPFT